MLDEVKLHVGVWSSSSRSANECERWQEGLQLQALAMRAHAMQPTTECGHRKAESLVHGAGNQHAVIRRRLAKPQGDCNLPGARLALDITHLNPPCM
jgi:hypothetical protein